LGPAFQKEIDPNSFIKLSEMWDISLLSGLLTSALDGGDGVRFTAHPGIPEPVWVLWRRETLLPAGNLNPHSLAVQLIASHCILQSVEFRFNLDQ
jgi:hypothetical protein